LPGNIASVGLDENDAIPEFGARGFNVLWVCARDGDASAFGDELAGGFKTDTAGAASDQGCLVLQA
jgi:hypothetical protein